MIAACYNTTVAEFNYNTEFTVDRKHNLQKSGARRREKENSAEICAKHQGVSDDVLSRATLNKSPQNIVSYLKTRILDNTITDKEKDIWELCSRWRSKSIEHGESLSNNKQQLRKIEQLEKSQIH